MASDEWTATADFFEGRERSATADLLENLSDMIAIPPLPPIRKQDYILHATGVIGSRHAKAPIANGMDDG
jgi:hypothetical protein